MTDDYFIRYILEKGTIKEIKVKKKDALKDIDELLKEDKDFLDIMAKM